MRLVGSDNRGLSRQAKSSKESSPFKLLNALSIISVPQGWLHQSLSSIDNAPVYTLIHDYLIEEINQHFKERSDLQS